MSKLTLLALLAVITGVWAIVCALIYRQYRHAAWLAGSTVATCLFFLGATVAASFLVEGALFLLPLWVLVAVLAVVHLRAACRHAAAEGDLVLHQAQLQAKHPKATQPGGESSNRSPASQQLRGGTYI
jgi:hypothetical protein